MKKISFLLSFFLIAGAGCALTPQAVKVKPDVEIISDQTVTKKQVQLEIVDERPRQQLGKRTYGMSAQITIAGNITDTLRQSISDGLTQKGFLVTPNKPPDGRELRVEIRDIDYKYNQGFLVNSVTVNCVIKGICLIGSSRSYENLYRGDIQENVMFIQTGTANEKYVNAAISKAINSLLNDQQLMQCLAK